MKTILPWIKIIFAVTAFTFIGYFAWDSRGQAGAIIAQADVALLLLSIMIWITLHFVAPWFPASIFGSFSSRLSFRDAFYINASKLPAKYLPGGVWHSVARIEGYHGSGVRARNIALYFLVENIGAAGVTLLVGACLMMMSNHLTPAFYNLFKAIIFVALICLLLMPVIINRYLLKDAHLSSKHYLVGMLVLFFYWIGAGLSFFIYVLSMPSLEGALGVIEIMGVYLFSWGIGFLALFAPQGIGVSEYVASLLMPGTLTPSVMITLLASFRVIILIADLSTWAISWFLKRDVVIEDAGHT